jgi:glutamine synthetase
MSIFLGTDLEKVFTAIESGSGDAATPQSYLELGASVLPKLPKHGGDRNRTSPFAFTGNKFEFRALGSSMSLGLPNTVLNTIVAQAVDRMASAVEEATAGGSSLEEAVLAVVKDTWSTHKRIVFDGDGYSDDWHAEAERRGLANLRQTPDALPWLVEPATVDVFEHYDVLTERELEARYEVSVEQYTTTINIEGETAASIARTMLLPAAVQWAGLLGRSGDGAGVTRLKAEADGLVDEFVETIFALEEANANHPVEADPLDAARYVQQTVIPAMAEVRAVADRLEKIVPDDLWPLPKYAEILFIK